MRNGKLSGRSVQDRTRKRHSLDLHWLILSPVLLVTTPGALSQTVQAQDNKALLTRPAVAGAPREAITSGNAIYEVLVQDVPGFGLGLYTARTGPAHPVRGRNLLFGGESSRTGTSYTTIRSYTTNTDYVQRVASSPGFTAFNLEPFGVVRPFEPGGIQTVYDLTAPGAAPDRLRIVQTIRIIGTDLSDSRIEFHLRVENAGSTPVQIGIRHLWDFQMGDDDGPTFTPRAPDGPAIVTEATFIPPEFSFYRVEDNDFDDPTSPLYQTFGTALGPALFFPTRPDAIKHVAWPLAYETAFNYTADPNLIVSTFAAPFRGFAGGDSAVLIYFGATPEQAMEILPGQSRSVQVSLFAFSAPEPSASRNPVLIVPGIAGSSSVRLIPGASFFSHDGWNLEQITKSYNALYDALQKAGYRAVAPSPGVEWLPEPQHGWETEESNANLFPAPYDWRQPIAQIVENFLMKQIDRAKRIACGGEASCVEAKKVDLVAFSLGGLAARAYVQGRNYRNDVDRLILLGVPNHGSASVYSWWEGAAPPDPLLEVLGDLALAIDLTDVLLQGLSPWTVISLGLEFRAPAIRAYAPSLQELLPDSEYLRDHSSGALKPYASLSDLGRNPTLPSLNANPLPEAVQQRTTVRGGTGKPTIKVIRVMDRDLLDVLFLRWHDGTPIGLETSQAGDGVVLESSLRLNDAVRVETIADTDHLCVSERSINRIVSILLERPVDGLDAQCSLWESFLVISLASAINSPPAANLLIIDPLGRRLGFDPVEQLVRTDIPGSFFSGRDRVTLLIIPDPIAGDYQFQITGSSPGNYGVAASYLGTEGNDSIESMGRVDAGTLENFAVTLRPDHADILRSNLPPAADLAVSFEAPSVAVVGTNLSLTLRVGNAGPDAASRVVVSTTLPGPVEFISATPDRGSCSGTTILSCDFGVVAKEELVGVLLVLRPTAAGRFNFETRVTSSTADLFEVNNSSSAEIAINNPSPRTVSLSPTSLPAASGGFTLTVNGSGFVSGSVVRWNGSDRPTTLVSSVQLHASISASDIAAGGISQVTVVNPAPGGGTSSALAFAVTDFGISASPSDAAVRAGQSATYTITAAPQFGPFGNAVTFACSGLPALAACSFNPASVTPGANPANTTLTITTTAASLVPPTGRRLPPLSPLAPVVGLLGLALLLVLASARYEAQRQRAGAAAGFALLVALGILQIACASTEGTPSPPRQPGTPPGTYTVTVNASSGSLQHSATVSLRVE